MKIGIIDYGAGNINSVYNSVYNLGYDPIIIKNQKDLKNIQKIIIPGVGSAFNSIKIFKEKNLFEEIKKIINTNIPILGICLGFQIFSRNLFEGGESNGWNLINAKVVPIDNPAIFNIGWCEVDIDKDLAINIGIKEKTNFYFCHSYFLDNINNQDRKFVLGYTTFKKKIPSLIIKSNFMGVQFHPEKSQSNGNKLLKYFLKWQPQ
jgi:imidazole glycerol-phosphate synthase subunit HisH